MAIRSMKHVLGLVLPLCIVTLVTPTLCIDDEFTPRLYIFGDSVFDPGNAQILTPSNPYGKLPYGVSMQNQSFAYGTGRISDGLLIPDYIALFANLGIIPPFLKLGANYEYGVNFATAAGGALDTANKVNFKQQLANFESVLKELKEETSSADTRRIIKKSVFLIGFGGADYISYTTLTAPRADKIAFVNRVVDSICSSVFEIYKQGGRKFALLNVAPVGCTPSIKQAKSLGDNKCDEQLNDLARQHKLALIKAAKKLQMQLPGINSTVFDFYTTLAERMNNPDKYGFKEGGNNACCGTGARRGASCGGGGYQACPDPTQYVFFEGSMTSQTVHYQLASLLWNGPSNVSQPYNLKHFFEDSPTTNLLEYSALPAPEATAA